MELLGKSDMEGETARDAASDSGNERVSKERELVSQFAVRNFFLLNSAFILLSPPSLLILNSYF